MKTAIYAGSFDPFTNGHLDILKTGIEIFDKVIVLVANNSQKKYLLSVETRVELIRKSVNHIKNVEVDFWNGLTVEYAKKNNINILIRGLRNSVDYEYESQLAQINAKLANNIQTVFLPATSECNFISSGMIRELLINKGDITGFVPTVVKEYLLSDEYNRFQPQSNCPDGT